MAYPDLQTMFNNGMGSFAAIQAGQQQADAQQTQQAEMAQKAALLQKQQLENQQSQVMNPLDAMFRQGQVNQQSAQLPGIQAQSSSLQTNAQFDAATVSSKIAASISDNQDKIGADGMKQMERSAAIARNTASILQTVPVMQRPQVLKSVIDQYGGDSKTAFMNQFLQMPPDKMPDMISAVGQGMAQASDTYITEMSKQKAANEAHIQAAKIGAGATVRAAEIGADARTESAQTAANARLQVAIDHMNSDQKYTFLSGIPEAQRTPAQQDQLQRVTAQRLAEAAARGNSVPSQIMDIASPGKVAQQASPWAQQPQQAPITPTTITAPPGMIQVGTSAGKPVYGDSANPQDKSKWKY